MRFPLGTGLLLAMAMGGGTAYCEGPPGNRTGAFLGPASEWEEAAIVLHQWSEMFGGRFYFIHGSGTVVVVDISRDSVGKVVERRFESLDAAEPVGQLFETVLELDLLATTLEREDQPLPTDGGPPLFVLLGRGGKVRSLPLIRGAPSPAYEEVLLEAAALMRLFRGREPTYEGAYVPGYRPKGFEWATETLASVGDLRWAPFATAGEAARAEEEYLKKVELQILAIERVKSEEKKSKDQN